MKPQILLVLGILAVLLVPGCTQTDTNLPSQNTGGNLFTENLMFNGSDTTGYITKNKLTKTFIGEMNVQINDSMEYVNILNQNISAVPLMVNTACGMLPPVIFNGSWQIETTAGSVFRDGYKAEKFHIVFTDKETGEKIAECTATGPDWEDITFQKYREYEYSLMNIKIGERGETQNQVASTEVKSECPVANKPTTFVFEWGKLIGGDSALGLNMNFIKTLDFSDNWVLDNLPYYSEYTSSDFICERGSKEGENVNKLYCRPTLMYEPTIKRNTIDQQGNITESEYLYIKEFIFDITGKDIQNVEDLKSLKLESIICSESSF